MPERGILTILSGFSGAGKGTVVKRLLEKYDRYALSVSVTTRHPRPGEKEGVDYFFRTQDEFDKIKREGGFLESAAYVDHSYGTPASYVEEVLSSGRDCILEIELQGAMQVRSKMKDALLVFVAPPSAEELKKRLSGRKTEEPSVIASRLKRAREEAKGMDSYDYLLVNDEVEGCVDALHTLILTQHMRMSRKKDYIERIRRELQMLSVD